jgi:hypothetical protein
MDFVVQSNGFKWINMRISPIQMDFKLQGNQFIWTSNYKLTDPIGVFDNSITSNGVQITNQPIQMNFVTI